MQRTSFFVAGTLALLLGSTLVAHAQAIVYNDTTTFTGSGYINGGATSGSPITTLVADDINALAGSGGQTVTQFAFSVANFDTVTFTARPRVRFYAADGTGGSPGTYITGYSFNPISFTAGSVNIFNATGTSAFVLPANGKFWAGITFDNSTATATVANLNNLGQGLYDPPTVGSSSPSAFQTTASGSFVSNNPSGSTFTLSSGTPANFGWQFQLATAPAPEPSQYAALAIGVLGLGTLALKARRRQQAA